MSDTPNLPQNFIRTIIDRDLESGKHDGVVTRFPPEPNGYLHVGHAKSICLNFGVAGDYQGRCNLRFDDTNPAKEEAAYAHAIEEDIQWLGFQWAETRHASDYFEDLYRYAEELVERGLAYVDSLDAEQMRAYRGTLKEPGKNSPYRDRSVEENLDLFRRMRAGEFPDGAHVLRARIDMGSPNINMRDPAIYRIKHVDHHRTGDAWCIYPMYDFTHCISDAIEGITHSLCTLEFEDHRPLYDWVLDNITIPCHPQQIEFARLELLYTVTSKRKLKQLVDEDIVEGWDDPRMPTISAMRRRGYTPESIRDFCGRIGVSKAKNNVELGVLENSVREDLSHRCRRVMAVVRPLKVVITNWPEDRVEMMPAPYHPQNPDLGSREMPFTRELYIEQDDFMEDPPRKYFRLRPGGAVRLRFGYVIDCQEVIKDAAGNVVELHCTYDPETRSGTGTSERKVKGTVHWVSASKGEPAEVRLYDRLFVLPRPDASKDGTTFLDHLNPESLEVVSNAVVEPSVAGAAAEERFQFERLGYFVTDRRDSQPGQLVFNRTVTLRDGWAKIEQQNRESAS